MSLQRRLTPHVVKFLTGEGHLRRRRRLLEWRRRLRRQPHQARFYFRIDDPYSLLLAQVLPAFAEHYGIRIVPRVMLYLNTDLYPAPEQLNELAPRDVQALARLHGLEFPEHWTLPDHDSSLAATRCLLQHEGDERFWSLAHALGQALWSHDQERLNELLASHGQQPEDRARLALEARRDQFLQDGHYLTATVHYQGEWYWSIERLDHLASRLEKLGLGGGERPRDYGIAKRARLERPADDRTGQEPQPAQEHQPAQGRPPLILYFSFRSPYSYIALQRAYALADHYGVTLELRPILPMVMRGLTVPRAKQLYIVTDTAREARLHGVPFGKMCDPVGNGVERCMALWPFAEKEGRLREWLLAAGRGIWSRGQDPATDAGLRSMAEAAGLDWNRARRWLDDDQWRERAEVHRQALLEAGCWGVPTFQVGETAIWGQDRFALIEELLRQGH